MQQRMLEFVSEEPEVVALDSAVEKPLVTLMARLIVEIIQDHEGRKHAQQTDQQ